MPAIGARVKPSLRKILADSHVAAAAIAVLLIWFADLLFRALWDPITLAGNFFFTAVAIFDIPYISQTRTPFDFSLLFNTLTSLFFSLASVFAAWLLSRWIYGVGPFASLKGVHARLTRSNHA
jgi:hypothetical protein